MEMRQSLGSYHFIPWEKPTVLFWHVDCWQSSKSLKHNQTSSSQSLYRLSHWLP